MDVIERVAVNLLHDVGSAPSARPKDIGIGYALGVEIAGKEVSEAVEGVVWFNAQ
jgi:hypothetical protein